MIDGESWIWKEVIKDNYIIDPLLQQPDNKYNKAEIYADLIINMY